MATVSDELVERVARAIYAVRHARWDDQRSAMQELYRAEARAAIAALSTPEFVLPLAEEMLRSKGVDEIGMEAHYVALCGDYVSHVADTLLDAYRAAKGE